MNGLLKAMATAAIGGAVPAALSTLQNCGSDWNTLLTQCLAGAVVAVAALYIKPPSQKDDDGTPDPGGNR